MGISISTTAVGEEGSSPESGSGVASSGEDPEEQLGDDELDHLEMAEEENEEIGVFLDEGPRDEQMDEQTELYRARMAALEVTEEIISRFEESVQWIIECQDQSDQAAKNMAKEYLKTGMSVGFLMGCVVMFALLKRN